MRNNKRIREKLKTLTDDPGCYLWKDAKGTVIYVGKAIRLIHRVKSYLNPNQSDPKTRQLQSEIWDVDWIITHSEIEALILEATLIKKYNPRFNVRLKDDKRYPYIAVSTSEMYPMVYLTRRIRPGKDRYFGPFPDSRTARDTLNVLQKIFPIRKTKLKLPLPKPQRPCLNFHMKRCLGPCQGNVPVKDYEGIVSEILKFLEGKKDDLIQSLRSKMQDHSSRMEYEMAGRYRDMLDLVQKFREKQTVVSIEGGDEDIISFAKRGNEAQVVLLEVRGGRLESKKSFPMTGIESAPDEEILSSFVRDYYLQSGFIPRTIILPIALKQESNLIWDHLQKNFGFIPKVKQPSNGPKKSLIRLAEKNAELSLTERLLATKQRDQTLALKELKNILKLKDLPRVIECYDISHIQGYEPVASGVMFVEGKPHKAGYRHYNIRGYKGINDPGMIHEVIARRLQRLINEDESLPDLIVIDGGPTQLNRACEASLALDLPHLPMIGLAKKREEVYFPGEKEPYIFPLHSPMMKLLRYIRDEAHRFGITHHRKRRNQATIRSVLEEIPDIGQERKKVLLAYFRDKKKVQDASIEELKEVEGIGSVLAKKIFDILHSTPPKPISRKKNHPN